MVDETSVQRRPALSCSELKTRAETNRDTHGRRQHKILCLLLEKYQTNFTVCKRNLCHHFSAFLFNIGFTSQASTIIESLAFVSTWRTFASIPWPTGCNDLGPSCKYALSPAPTDRRDSGRKAMSKCSKALSIWSKLATIDYVRCPSKCCRCYWCSDDKCASWKRLSAAWTDNPSGNE